jgi:hypothetical protein
MQLAEQGVQLLPNTHGMACGVWYTSRLGRSERSAGTGAIHRFVQCTCHKWQAACVVCAVGPSQPTCCVAALPGFTSCSA